MNALLTVKPRLGAVFKIDGQKWKVLLATKVPERDEWFVWIEPVK